MEEVELEVSMDKKYTLPEFKMVKYAGRYLAIDVEHAKWIVLNSDMQKTLLECLVNGYSLEDIVNQFEDVEEDLMEVLIQIEAKKIESMTTKSVFTNSKLHLHLTNKCNMRCPHCYMNAGEGYKDELSTDEIKELISNFNKVGGTHLSITGGEPVVRSDFSEIVEYADSLGMTISVFSNGTLWSDELIEKIAKCNVEGVQISLDGYDEESNSVVRGKGFFDKAMSTIDALIKKGIYVKIAVTPTYEVVKENYQKYIDFSKQLIQKYTEDYIELNYSFFLMAGRELDNDVIRKNKDDYYNIINKIVTAIYGEYEGDSFVANVFEKKRDSCGFGGLNVMANGDFYFCDRIPDVNAIGNIRSIEFSKLYEHMKKAEKAGLIDNFKPCADCELKYICGGGCRAEFFPQFTKLTDFENVEFDSIPKRSCSEKEHIYHLMIDTNERFFS